MCVQETENVRAVAATLIKTHLAVDLSVGANDARRKAAIHALQKLDETLVAECVRIRRSFAFVVVSLLLLLCACSCCCCPLLLVAAGLTLLACSPDAPFTSHSSASSAVLSVC